LAEAISSLSVLAGTLLAASTSSGASPTRATGWKSACGS
jgi:hypothetical protein